MYRVWDKPEKEAKKEQDMRIKYRRRVEDWVWDRWDESTWEKE